MENRAPHPERSSPGEGALYISRLPKRCERAKETFRHKLSENQNMHNAIVLPLAPATSTLQQLP